MTNKILFVFKNKVLVNGVWLYSLQIFNTVVPLLTLPYITRILGVSQYGVFSISLNLVSYFQVIVEYGFNLSGARKIALTNNRDEQSRIYSRITASKLLLCLISFIFMVIICVITKIEKTQIICMFILFTTVIGTAIQQTWLFQGLEEMQYITIINVISRTISVLLIFSIVKRSNQLYLYCTLYSVTSLLIGIISIFLVNIKLGIKFIKIKFQNIIEELKDGWYTFTTSAISKVFTGIGITVLGFSNDKSIVGAYSAIQKIPLVMTMMYSPVGQAIFPYMSRKYSVSFENGITILKKIARLLISFVLFFSFCIILFTKKLVTILYGNEYTSYYLLLVPLVCWLLLSITNNLLGIQVLVASGHLKEYSIAFEISAVSIVLSNIILGILWGAYGVAVATMISEFIMTITCILQIKRIRNKLVN